MSLESRFPHPPAPVKDRLTVQKLSQFYPLIFAPCLYVAFSVFSIIILT